MHMNFARVPMVAIGKSLFKFKGEESETIFNSTNISIGDVILLQSNNYCTVNCDARSNIMLLITTIMIKGTILCF